VRALPTGTVTLLFTDIEGSTRLLRELGDRYADVLEEHRRILRSAFERHGGVVFGSEGDALFVVFTRARDAVQAAAEARAALEQGPVRVRIGIHTGEPIVREGGYVGLDVHRAARIAGAGHGGQVLLSGATSRLLGDEPALHDLGEHRLKDLVEPEHLFQLGDGDFPPLRSLSNTNLPVPASSLVGREREVADVADLLRGDEVRLLTLTGPGGAGKTRLAIAVGAEVAREFPNGVFFVPLASISDAELVAPTIAHTLGIAEQPGEPLVDTLVAHLEPKRLLLVMDNFEQVLEAAPALSELLERAPRLRSLATSREALRLAGEREYALPPLRPDDAVTLFAERARAADRTFVLNGDAAVAREICDRLDRLPLAIELAAAGIKLLSPRAILDRLDRRLALTVSRRRDLPSRHQTLRAAIDWSHDLLGDDERTLFARLAVFAGGWTVESAEAVCGAGLETLAALVDKSLVRGSEAGRLSMLQTIREYAQERLAELPDAERVREAHARHFLELAETAERQFQGPEQLQWLARLEDEQDNVRAALAWTLREPARADRAELALRLAAAAGSFWYARSYAREGCSWLEHVVAAASSGPPTARARALHVLGILADQLGDQERAMAVIEESLAVYRERDDRVALARGLNSLGIVARNRGDLPRARAYLTETVELRRALGDVAAVSRATGNLGLLVFDEGDLEQARALLEESLGLERELGDLAGVAVNLVNLAAVALADEDPDRAGTLLVEAFEAFQEVGDREGLAECLELTAALAAGSERHEAAGRIAGAAAALRDAIGVPVASPADRARLERYLRRAREALGDEEFERAFAAGAELSQGSAVAEALAALRDGTPI
jgi:predicted ATPase/class 3 adenylate cyclase